MAQLIVIVAMFALLWLLLIRPQQRRHRRSSELVSGRSPATRSSPSAASTGPCVEFGTRTSSSSRSRPGRTSASPGGRSRRCSRRRRERRAGGARRGRARGRPSADERDPQLTCPPLVNRRPHLILVALIVAALVGVGLIAIPGSPLRRSRRLGLDLQGGLEVTLAGGAGEEPAAAEGRPRPVGRDHPEPRRQARRRRARDPQAGLEPDRDRPARREEPGRR